MIDTLPTEAKINWQEQIPTLVHAYNCSHLNVTGFSPFYLMYDRHPMLPIDIMFGVQTPDIVASTSHSDIQKLQKRLEWAYKTADEISKKESECSKKQYNQNIRCTRLELEDLFLVRQKAFKGKHKISNRWEIPLIMWLSIKVYTFQSIRCSSQEEPQNLEFSIEICCFLSLYEMRVRLNKKSWKKRSRI